MTPKQKQLVRELDRVVSRLGLDYQNIDNYKKEHRTLYLELIKRHAIRGEVVQEYIMIDEFLNNRLCQYFFGKKRSSIQLWKTKRFQIFNYHVIEQLSLLEKLRFAKDISKIPRQVAADIERLTLDGLNRFSEDMVRVHEQFRGES